MNPPRVYVETTIPSFYFDERQTPEIVAQRHWTREWWADARKRHDLVTSAATWGEIFRGPIHRQQRWIEFLLQIELLTLVRPVFAIEDTYISEKLMPAVRDADALHLAVASYYECEYLVTWNYRHLANANKFEHIRRVNRRLGLSVPEIVTPRQLMGGSDDR